MQKSKTKIVNYALVIAYLLLLIESPLHGQDKVRKLINSPITFSEEVQGIIVWEFLHDEKRF